MVWYQKVLNIYFIEQSLLHTTYHTSDFTEQEIFSHEKLGLLALGINSGSKIHSLLNCAVVHTDAAHIAPSLDGEF